MSKGLGKSNKAHLRGTVVGLPHIPIQPCRASGVDDTAEFLLSEMGPGSFCARECTFDVDKSDCVPLLLTECKLQDLI
jgi:hypothetical protein